MRRTALACAALGASFCAGAGHAETFEKKTPESVRYARNLVDHLNATTDGGCKLLLAEAQVPDVSDPAQTLQVPVALQGADGQSEPVTLQFQQQSHVTRTAADVLAAGLSAQLAAHGCKAAELSQADRTAAEAVRQFQCNVKSFNDVPGGKANMNVGQPAVQQSDDGEVILSDVPAPGRQLELLAQSRSGFPVTVDRVPAQREEAFTDAWSLGNNVAQISLRTQSTWKPAALEAHLHGQVDVSILGSKPEPIVTGAADTWREASKAHAKVRYAALGFDVREEQYDFGSDEPEDQGDDVFKGEIWRYDTIVPVGPVPIHVYAAVTEELSYKLEYRATQDPATGAFAHALSFLPSTAARLTVWGGPDVVVAKGGVGGDLDLVKGAIRVTARADESAQTACGEAILEKPTVLAGKVYADVSVDFAQALPVTQVFDGACQMLEQFNPFRLQKLATNTVRDFAQQSQQQLEQASEVVEQAVNYITQPAASVQRTLQDKVSDAEEYVCARTAGLCDMAAVKMPRPNCDVTNGCGVKVPVRMPKVRIRGLGVAANDPQLASCQEISARVQAATHLRYVKYLFHFDGMTAGEESKPWFSSCGAKRT